MPKRLLVSISTIIILLTGCSSEPVDSTPLMQECLENGQVEYLDECVDWNEVPQEDMEDVVNDMADWIAERDGVTKKEALQFMMDTMDNIINEK